MSKLRWLVLLCLTFVAIDSHATGFVARHVQVDGHSYNYQVFVPQGWTAARRWPVVLFLHGSGERGNDNQKQLAQGLPPWLSKHPDFPAVVIAPQAPDGTIWTDLQERVALAALDDSIATYHGDRDRLYLTGISMGGYGAWQIAANHPGLFAAAAIICGGVTPPNDELNLGFQNLPAGKDPYAWVAAKVAPLPVWIFHGAIDDVVPPRESEHMYAALKAIGDDVRFTEFPGVNHGSWNAAYATPELWPWMFGHTRQTAAVGTRH